jgi:hypothetical protein
MSQHTAAFCVSPVGQRTEHATILDALTEFGKTRAGLEHSMVATSMRLQFATAPIVELQNVRSTLPDFCPDSLKDALEVALTAHEQENAVAVKYVLVWFERNKTLCLAWQFLDQNNKNAGVFRAARVNINE